MKDETSWSALLLGCFGMVVGAVGLVVLATVVNGWALTVLWQWFIVPTFGLPTLGIVQAVGLMSVIGFLRGNMSDFDMENWSESAKTLFKWIIVFLAPALSLTMGYIIQLFMPK